MILNMSFSNEVASVLPFCNNVRNVWLSFVLGYIYTLNATANATLFKVLILGNGLRY